MLKEQLQLIKIDCNTFDNGNEIIGKQIAVILRVLFHDTNNSTSLLKKLNIKFIKWMPSVTEINTNNILAECNFVIQEMIKANNVHGKYLPRFRTDFKTEKYIDFYDWWTKPVIKDKDKNAFSRKDVILFIANKDGGAHVDSEIKESEKFLITPNSLGWKSYNDGIVEDFEGRVELICIRQIAYEVIESIKKAYPELID